MRSFRRPEGGSGDASFTFTPSWGAAFELSGGQSADSGALAPGTYSVSETVVPAEWDLTSAVCSDGSSPSAVVLDSGGAVVLANRAMADLVGEGPLEGRPYWETLRQPGFSILISRTEETLANQACEVEIGERSLLCATSLLPGGGMVIDTPGLRELALWDLEVGVEGAFPEIDALALRCRFTNCQHETEPGGNSL